MILMLGDSLTEWGNWQTLLAREDIINEGISGETTYDILGRIDYVIQNATNLKADKAFIMCGINDIYQGYSVSEVFQNYEKIVQKCLEKIPAIIIQSTVFASDDEFMKDINERVKKLNGMLLELSSKSPKLTYADINSVLAPNGFLEDEHTTDGVHFSSKGYRVWADELIQRYLW